jgi:hypothetical protein
VELSLSVGFEMIHIFITCRAEKFNITA